MRLLIVLPVLLAIASTEAKYFLTPLYEYRGPPAPLASDGRVMETPEVRRARNSHMAAHASTLARIREIERNDYTEKMMQMQMAPMMMKPAPVRTVSIAPLSPDGRVVDTAEVAQAKAAHLAAHAKAARLAAAAATASTQYRLDLYDGRRNLVFLPVRINYAVSPVGYRGPPAPLGPDGHVIDTPEVARARAAHMKARAHALAMVSHRMRLYKTKREGEKDDARRLIKHIPKLFALGVECDQTS